MFDNAANCSIMAPLVKRLAEKRLSKGKMPRRKKQQRRRVSVNRAAPPPMAETRSEQTGMAAKPAVAAKAAAAAKVDLAEEYHYVFADLRKIAVIAAAMFVLLFGLAFVLK